MTEGTDEHQIHLLNANTNGMIRQKVGQLQKQCSLKKQTSQISESDLPSPSLHRQISNRHLANGSLNLNRQIH